MADVRVLVASLLRPAILQILRAAGFYAARPTVVDALTSMCGAYIHLIACRMHAYAISNHNTLPPDITDARLALADVGAILPTMTASEELWKEIFAKLGGNVYGGGADSDDEVTKFAEWVRGPAIHEQKRIAGFLGDEGVVELDGQDHKEDYVTALKKKHSKTGEESRFQGTVLGKNSDLHPVPIDGGPTSIREWQHLMMERMARLAEVSDTSDQEVNGDSSTMEDVQSSQTNDSTG